MVAFVLHEVLPGSQRLANFLPLCQVTQANAELVPSSCSCEVLDEGQAAQIFEQLLKVPCKDVCGLVELTASREGL